jgi:hypothetical protein
MFSGRATAFLAKETHHLRSPARPVPLVWSSALSSPMSSSDRAKSKICAFSNRPGRDYVFELAGAEIADADGAGEPKLARLLHPRPCPGGSTSGKVDEVQVHLVNTEPPEALLGCGNRVITPPRLELGPWIELGGEKYLAARHAAVAERLSDALLVAVSLGRVDKAIPCVERPAYGVHARRSVGNLPDAQTEHRHLVSIGEDARAPVWGDCAECHGWLLFATLRSPPLRPSLR